MQPRCSLRSSLARGAARGGGNELPGGGQRAQGFAWNVGDLGSPLRAIWFRRGERLRGPGPASTIGCGRDKTGESGAGEESGPLSPASPALGRSAIISLCRAPVRGDAAGSPVVPAIIPPPRFSFAQTAPRDCPSRPARAGRRKENPSALPPTIRSRLRRWTMSIFDSTEAAVECGFRRKSGTRSACLRRFVRVSATLAPYASATAAWSPPRPKAALTLKPAGPFWASCARAAAVAATASSSSSITPNITTPRSMPGGVDCPSGGFSLHQIRPAGIWPETHPHHHGRGNRARPHSRAILPLATLKEICLS